MDYEINPKCWEQVFAVPVCVVDEFSKLASGKAIKVLLYFLRHRDALNDAANLAQNLKIDVEEIEDILLFWEQVHVLSKSTINSEKNLIPSPVISSKKTIPSEHATPKQPPLPSQTPSVKPPANKMLSPKEIAQRIEESEEIRYLLASAETFMGHLLNYTEQRSFIWIHDFLNLSADVIMMLLEYCRISGKISVNYIQRMAITWNEKCIETHEEAEREIALLMERNTLRGQVISAFGLSVNKLSEKQDKFVSQWTQWQVNEDMLSLAYDQCIDTIHKLSFAYINSILEKWHTKGLHKKEDILKEISNGKKYFKEKLSKEDEHSYDINKFDALAVNVSSKNLKETK